MRNYLALLLAVFTLLGAACSSGDGSPSPVDPRSIGANCESSSDCESGLFCNTNPVDDLLDSQCTAPCAVTQPCSASFGPSAACLLSNLCIRTCTADADCPSGTHCNQHLWCERTAAPPTPTTLRCVGNAMGCAAIDKVHFDCSDVPGCSSEERCVGQPEPCSSQGFDCPLGCSYDIDLEGCTGAPWACDSYSNAYDCERVVGCSWDFFCVGTPRSCELLTADVCEKMPGCTLE